MKLGMLTMTDLVLSLLCAAGLYLILLEDRFRLWATVACYGAAYLVSLGVGWIVTRVLGPSWAVAAGALVLFMASLVLSRNDPLQKFYLAVLALSCHFYLEAFLPLALGVMPFSTAGAFAGFFSLACQLLFSALAGLCLYRPFHHFSDRGPSAFLWGMCLVQLVIFQILPPGPFKYPADKTAPGSPFIPGHFQGSVSAGFSLRGHPEACKCHTIHRFRPPSGAGEAVPA